MKSMAIFYQMHFWLIVQSVILMFNSDIYFKIKLYLFNLLVAEELSGAGKGGEGTIVVVPP